jgi:hypothetical protein
VSSKDLGGRIADFFTRLYERERAEGFPSFAGSTIHVRVPLTQRVVDDLLLAGRPEDPAKRGAVQSMRLVLLGPDHIGYEITVRTFLFTPTFQLEGRVQPVVPFPHDPRIHLTLLTGGLTGALVKAAPLPDWIGLDGRHVTLNIGMLLRRGGLDWLIPLVRSCRVSVQRGVMFWDLELATPEDARAAGTLPTTNTITETMDGEPDR